MFEKSKPPKSVKIQGISQYFFWKIYPFCAKFFDKFKIRFFFHFFTTDVLTLLVGEPKVASKIYRVVFEKKAKKKEGLTDRPTRQYKKLEGSKNAINPIGY